MTCITNHMAVKCQCEKCTGMFFARALNFLTETGSFFLFRFRLGLMTVACIGDGFLLCWVFAGTGHVELMLMLRRKVLIRSDYVRCVLNRDECWFRTERWRGWDGTLVFLFPLCFVSFQVDGPRLGLVSRTIYFICFNDPVSYFSYCILLCKDPSLQTR